MPVSFKEWLTGLIPERKRPEKIKVERTREDDDDLLIYKPVFGGRRAIGVRTMARRKAYRRPVAPLFSNKMEDEGRQLLLAELAPPNYDWEFPCKFCSSGTLFKSEYAWRSYLGEKLEQLVLHPVADLSKVKWRRVCRHCRKFLRQWYDPCRKARGELRVRHQLENLSSALKTTELNSFVVEWADRYKELRKELKKGGASDDALKKFREIVSQTLKEVG